MEIYSNLKKEVARGRVGEVIEPLLTHLEHRNPDAYKAVLKLSRRFATLRQQTRAGVLTESEQRAEINRISNDLIEILTELETGKKRPPVSPEKRNITLLVAGFVLAVAGGALAFMMLAKKDESFSLTVFVQDREKNMVLKNKGEVVIDFDGDRRRKKINENGEAVFREIPAHFMGKNVPVIVEADIYKSTKPDSVYLFKEDGKIYVEVEKYGLDELTGEVRDESGMPLGGVRVSIADVADTTDIHGRFKIQIPEKLQKEQQTVVLYKSGFHREEKFATPGTHEELKVILKKQ